MLWRGRGDPRVPPRYSRMIPDDAFYVVVACAAGSALLAWVYFRAYRVNRPPIGVINPRDAVLMIGAIVLVPYFYLIMPPAGGDAPRSGGC